MCKAEESTPLLTNKPQSKTSKVSSNTTRNEDEAGNGSNNKKFFLIVGAAFYSLFILNGAEYAFGCLMDPLMKESGLTRSTISIAGSTQVAFSAFTAPFASFLINKLGTRKVSTIGCVASTIGLIGASFCIEFVGLLSFLSILTGSGFGLMYMGAMVAVAENFTSRRSLALGLSLCGPAVGQIVLSPLMNWITEDYGWRTCLRVLSGLCLLSVLTGIVLVQPTKDSGSSNSTTEDEDDLNLIDGERPYLSWLLGSQLSRHKYVWVFLLLVMADFFAVMALFVPYGYIQPVAARTNIPNHMISLLISAIGVGSVAGRMTSGFVTNQTWSRPLNLIRAAIGLVSGLPFVLTFVDKFWMYACTCIMFGFLTGLWIAATSPFIVRLLGVSNLNKALGLLTFSQGAASLISPPLAGLSVEMSGEPVMSLYLCGCLLFISTTVYSAAIQIFNNKKKRIIVYDRFYTEL